LLIALGECLLFMYRRLNVGLCAAALGLSVTALLIVPLLLLPQAPLAAAAIAIAAALLTPFHAALLHEAIHGKLMKGERANRMAGRLLAICFGVAFEVVRYGHLAHHRFNRHALDRPDVLKGDATLPARFGYFANLLGGVYAVELLSTLMSLLPRRVLIARIGRLTRGDEASALAVVRGMQRAVADARLTRARVDCLAVLALYGVAFWLYGAAWPLLLASILIRGLIISLFDNAPHYGTPPVIHAPVFNLSLPAWARAVMLNQNLHGLHHRRPGLPWHALPAAFAADGIRYDGTFAQAVLRQFNGPQPACQARDFEAIS
jgi:fatty acid desaturase